ncbi:tRNA dihydrouridine(20/20a) synthase DusA [Marivita hallyeonensis]|uniref:tRNA-dihydrouridine(20/20a) synthase n=1 Tax=Marivita hallyeonensis TaxID=996342 RepID=A0A1M5S340_9RHOB|nr:tRNA dihydrouridine(20/20a) synthase DusA [Marivita hallyeonensis]SHH32708.1 tRNA-U16,U17-dihydrouridine synthase [Marivita hallyeonensis]
MPLNAATEGARLAVAPMMDWTDRHCRYFHRQISRQALLYTEMVTAPALVRGGAVHLLEFDADEHPVALQLGGSDPSELAEAARLGATAGYDEINLNVGCPSDRVQSGTFGAVLMKTPALVADCVAAMKAAVDVPVTVKCRIGVDDQLVEETLPAFIRQVADAGCDYLIIHARKAWLQGLSPKENRDIPPLDYDLVLRMKSEFPRLGMSINGGLETLAQAEDLLARGMDGVMIGRAAYHHPWEVLAEVDERVFGMKRASHTRYDVLDAMRSYIDAHLQRGGKLHQITRHMLGLFAGQPGARAWRRVLSEHATRPGADFGLIERALEAMQIPDRIAG